MYDRFLSEGVTQQHRRATRATLWVCRMYYSVLGVAVATPCNLYIILL